MDALHDDQELTLDEAMDATEAFARQMFQLGDDKADLRVQLAEAERVLGLIKGAETIDSARMWALSYFGEQPPF